MARIVDLGVTRYDWLPGDTAIANPAAPTLTELSAAGAVNISPYTVTTTTLGPEASDTVSEKSIVETSNVVTPTVGNYGGTLVLFRDGDEGGLYSESDLLDAFKGRPIGWIVKRTGLPAATAYAAAQQVEVYKVKADTVQQSGGGNDGYLKLTVPLLQQGTFNPAAVVAAGA